MRLALIALLCAVSAAAPLAAWAQMEQAYEAIRQREAARSEEDERCITLGTLKPLPDHVPTARELECKQIAEKELEIQMGIYRTWDPDFDKRHGLLEAGEAAEAREPSRPPAFRKAAAAELNDLMHAEVKEHTHLEADPALPMSGRYIIRVKGSAARFGVIPYEGDGAGSDPVDLSQLRVLGGDVLAAVSSRGTVYYDLRARRLPLVPMGSASSERFSLVYEAPAGGGAERAGPPRGLLVALGHALRVSGLPLGSGAMMEQAERHLRERGWPAGAGLPTLRLLRDGGITTLSFDGEPRYILLGRGGAVVMRR